MSYLLTLALVAVAMAPLMAGSASAADDVTAVTITYSGPDTLAIGVKQQYIVNVTGGPGSASDPTKYTYTITKSGKIATNVTLTGSSGGPITSGTFFFNLTTTTVTGELTLTISVNAYNSTWEDNVTEKLKLDIDVIVPISISATILNEGNVTANNVPVYFYLNDDPENRVLIYNTSVNLTALSSTTVTYNWTVFDISSGKHEILVLIDPNSEFVMLDSGSTESTMTIYYKVSGYGTTNAWLWGLLVILAIVFFLIYLRPAKRRGRKK